MSCREFERLLEDMLEGALSGVDHAAAQRHVASCRSCRELIEPMGLTLVPVGNEPPSTFLAAVLARTSRAERRTRWAETWRQWMLRPRFASEAAYLGVVVLSLAVVTLDRSGVDLRSEAGILLDRATSLWEKEKP